MRAIIARWDSWIIYLEAMTPLLIVVVIGTAVTTGLTSKPRLTRVISYYPLVKTLRKY